MRRPTALLIPLALAIIGVPAVSAQPLLEPDHPSRWLETTSLDRKTEPEVLHGAASAPLELAPGRWMVCAGGEDVAVRCDVRLAEGEPLAPPETGPGTAITGTILLGGRVAADARISLTPAGLASRQPFSVPLRWDSQKKELAREVRTGDDGRFQVPPLEPGAYLFEIVPQGGRIQTAGPFSVPAPETLLPPGQDPAEVQAIWDLGEIAFDAGMTVEVLVTDTAGTPLPEAKAGGHQGGTPETTVFFEAEADAEGKVRLSGIDPALPVHLVCVADGYVRMSGDFEVPPAATHCTMEPLAGASGRVLDEEEDPVAEATITLVGKQGGATHSNLRGDFSFEKLAAGDYELEVSAPGFRVATIAATLTPGQTTELEPIYLRRGETLRGKVIEGLTGEPLPGAAVSVVEPPGGGSTVTDDEGLFELEADPDHTPVLRIEAAGFPVHRKRISATAFEEDEPVVVELRPGGRIEVVAWAEDGEGPCVGCEFALGTEGDGWRRLETDSTGRAQSEPVVEGVYPVYRVQKRSTASVVTVSAGQDTRKASVVAGQTTTVEFGEPAVALEVRFRPAPPESWELWAEGPGWTRRADRLGAGVFRFRRPPGDPVELKLRDPGGGSLRAAALAADFDRDVFEVRLPAGRVLGNLVRENGPVQDLAITVVDTTPGARRAAVQSGEGGVFEIPYLAPGTYNLEVEGQVVRTFSVVEGGEVMLDRVAVGSVANAQ